MTPSTNAPRPPLWTRTALQSPHGAVLAAASLWVGGSLVVAAGTFWWQSTQMDGLTTFNPALLVPALAFAVLSFGLRTLRWHLFLGSAGAHPPFLSSLRIQLIGFSLTMTPGKIGEIYKCFLVEQGTGVPAARTAPIVLFEKLMDAGAFAFLAVVAAALLSLGADPVAGAVRTLVVLLAVGLGVTLILRRIEPDAVVGALLRIVGRYRIGRRIAAAAGLAVAGSIDLLSRRLIVRNGLISIGARTSDGLSLAWTMWAVGLDLPALVGVLALNSSGALGGLSMLPGGVGVVEASMTVVLAGFGAPAAAALAATLLVRFLTLWVWVGTGLALLVRSGVRVENS